MSVEQVIFYISPELEALIEQGDYTRCGGIVRNTDGRIVKHLEEIVLDPDEKVKKASTVVEKAGAFIVSHPKEAMIAAAGIGATAGLAAGIALGKKKQNYEHRKPVDFSKAFIDYLVSAQKGNLNLHRINELDATLVDLDKSDASKYQLVEKLLHYIMTPMQVYTLKLADKNNISLPDNELYFPDGISSDDIDELRLYLKAQRHIFELAA